MTRMRSAAGGHLAGGDGLPTGEQVQLEVVPANIAGAPVAAALADLPPPSGAAPLAGNQAAGGDGGGGGPSSGVPPASAGPTPFPAPVALSAGGDAAETTESGHTLAGRAIDFSKLVGVLDVLYGAVVGYGCYLIADTLSPWFRAQVEPAGINWIRLLLLAFVTNYLIADLVEARILNTAFPYQGRARFTLDIMIVLTFFGAYQAAAFQSRAVFVCLGGAILLGGLWAIFLDREYRALAWSYPRLIIATHVTAALLCFIGFSLSGHNVTAAVVTILGVGYLIWVAFIVALKVWHDVPPIECELFPVSLVDILVRRGLRWIQQRGAR